MKNSSLFQDEPDLYLEIEQDITHSYQLLTASRYVTNRNLEQVVSDAKIRISKVQNGNQVMSLLLYMFGIYSLSKRKNHYEEYQRRFTYFFQSMSTEIKQHLSELQSKDYQRFLRHLLSTVLNEQEDQKAPWSELLLDLMYEIETEHIEMIYKRLTSDINVDQCSKDVALLYSYVALLAGKEMTALTVLQKQSVQWKESELSSHFRLLSKRERWRTMKQWFHALFPNKKNGHFGSLQRFFDEMTSAIPVSSKEQQLLWERWLLSPNFHRFQMYSKHLSKEEQLQLLEKILPELEVRLHQLEAAKTYEKLLLTYKKYELAVKYLLNYEQDPLKLREEKSDLLKAIKSHDVTMARPVYHQYVVRLVEKKSRIYYEKAALYLKELQELYRTEEDKKQFFIYVDKLKKMYRTYRAFGEELKRIGY
ncbi:hypothetical protein JCM9140_1222 [Halalkalibacter wakoensis JCM 9140]|uniref:Uncharacterized protein n=1 Tax=Halalkalibacter wakoensis JCM 9140 TaxID=1236970 RepID=W4PZW6_9BACI|nr:hypothetical protein [Halalkalibacter wakoensis]GAE25240.1 hypothetical protein JCM9140_1222 [Halalkalibacter wakoensis JCM 9140]